MSRTGDPVLLALLTLSLGANAFLYLHRQPTAPIERGGLQPGDKLPVLRGTALDGRAVTDAFARPTVLYVFSPSCSWCERNLDNARAVAAGAGSRYKFLAITTVDTGVEDYLRIRGITWDIIKNVPMDILGAYRIRGTPQTIFIDAGGVVLHSWSGAYRDSAEQEVEGALGVLLPGLRLVRKQ